MLVSTRIHRASFPKFDSSYVEFRLRKRIPAWSVLMSSHNFPQFSIFHKRSMPSSCHHDDSINERKIHANSISSPFRRNLCFAQANCCSLNSNDSRSKQYFVERKEIAKKKYNNPRMCREGPMVWPVRGRIAPAMDRQRHRPTQIEPIFYHIRNPFPSNKSMTKRMHG